MRTVLSKFIIALLVASGVTLVTSASAQASCPFSTNGDTKQSAYLITTEAELREIRSCFSSGKKYFELGNNIRLTQKWDTIDLQSNREMHLEGNDFEISGLEMEASSGDLAMFKLGWGSIKNLSIRGGEIKNTGTGDTAVLVSTSQDYYEIDNVHIIMDKISGGSKIGGFIAEMSAPNANPGYVMNSSIKVVNGIHATSGTQRIGGVAVAIGPDGKIENVQVTADIDGSSSTSSNHWIGGVLSRTTNVTNKTNSVLDSHYEGSIVGNGSSTSRIGGLVGYQYAASGSELDIKRSSVRAELTSAEYIGGLLGYVLNSTSKKTTIEDNRFIGTLDSGTVSTPNMSGAVGFFDTPLTQGDNNLNRNFVQLSFDGSGTSDVHTIFDSWVAHPANLSNNIFDSELIDDGDYNTSKIQQDERNDSEIRGKTSAELQDESNYPWSSDIRSASTSPDFGTSPRVDVWGICYHADPAAAAAAGFETTAFLLTEVRRCASLPAITMDIASSQTVVEGTAITPVYPNNTSVTNLEAMRTSYYSVSPELPAGLSIHSRTGRLSGTPDSVDSTTYTLTATNGVSTQTTTFSLLPDPNSGSTAAPAPYTGPLVTSVGAEQTAGAFQTTSSATVTVYGERLSGVNKVFIEGKEAVIRSTSKDSFVMTLPDGLTDGVHDLVIQSPMGNLTYLDGISIAGETVEVFSYGEVSAWTSRISDTQIKVYVKFPTVGEKVRISHQVGGSGGYNTVYVKTTTSETMDGLRIVEGVGIYVVRTIDLEEINRIRVTVGDEQLVQVRYNN